MAGAAACAAAFVVPGSGWHQSRCFSKDGYNRSVEPGVLSMDDATLAVGPCLTSVHPSETSPHPLDVQSQAQHRLHAGVKEQRRKVIDAFLTSNNQALIKRAGKLGMCGVSPVVRLERGRRPALCPGRCRDRLCPLCSRLRAQQVRHRVKALVLKADAVRFVTLTMPKDDESLEKRIERLQAAFTKLRRRDFWKDRVKGGLFVIETTRGKSGGHWHVHLHCLVEGEYMVKSALKAEWAACLEGAEIVDIQACHSREKAISYVCKYVSKGSDVEKWSEEELCEYAVGVHRKRMFGTFGKWHKVDVSEERDSDEPGELPRHGTTWAKLKEAMDSGTLDREETVKALWQLGYVWRLLLKDEVDGELAVTVTPGAAAYDAVVTTMLDVEGIPTREQGPPPLIKVRERDGQTGLWPGTAYT